MTGAREWRGRVGDVWAAEWQRTDRAFAGLAPALDRAILAAAPDGPFRALDVGSGAGSTSLTLARQRPDATVLGIDVSPALVATARRRARGLANLTFEVGDAGERADRGEPFDLLLSRHGVMFFADPAAAFRGLRSATVPGGRFVFSCFADPARNGFAGPLAGALCLPAPATDGAPGPFAFAEPQRVTSLLTEAGWSLERLDQVAFDYRVGAGVQALDDAVDFLSRIGPAAAAMRVADGAARSAIQRGLRRFLADFVADNAVDLPASAWLMVAEAGGSGSTGEQS